MKYPTQAISSYLVASLAILQGVHSQYATKNGVHFEVDGATFNFAGTNIYDAALQNTGYATSVVDTVIANGYKVLRCWAFNEYDTSKGAAPGVYFQSWANGAPTPNTGANGLGLLDAVVAEAEKKNLKLILTLVNNWDDYGGMDVYVNQTKGDAAYHDLFYTDPTIAQHYMDYAKAVVSRYATSPAIFAWELTNEARCGGTGPNPQSPGTTCNPSVITTWMDKMSAYVKSIDPNHMVTSGIEGFFNRPSTAGSIYEYNGGPGQDFDAILALKNIDFGTIHTYLSSTSESYMDIPWTVKWLSDHDASGSQVNKPVIQEEYGVTRTDPKFNRQQTYDAWHAQILKSSSINGDMTWASLVVGGECPGSDGFAICQSDPDYAAEVMNWVGQMNGKK